MPTSNVAATQLTS